MLLELKDVSVNYGKVRALKNVSIVVEQGEMVSMVGANGAGKTTALRAVAGLHKLAGGEIWFDGQRIDGKSTEDIVKRGVGFCMEGRRLFPFMTVLENLQMGAYFRRGAQVKSDLEEVFTIFPVLKERQRQAAGTLSGGQQQMLTLGRSLMGKPKLLMLDEPSLGLAPIVVSDLAKTIKGFQEDRGLTVLLVEQNARMALRISNRAYALEVGIVAVEGDSASLAKDDYIKKAYLGV
jgi:branched-chain amino acid transport system ATP-binding protein